MDIIPLAEEPTEAPLPEANPAPIETSSLERQSLGMETLESRVLLASDASAAAKSADVEPAQSPAAYVAQQHAPHGQLAIGDVPPGAGDVPEPADSGSSTEAHAEAASGNPKAGGLGGSPTEPHAEIIERASELKENVEPEAREKVERRFDEKDSTLATIEPDGARSPQDRQAAQRLLGGAKATDAAAKEMDPAAPDSPEMAEATAAAIVSLTSQGEPVVDRLGLNPVVDRLAEKAAAEAATAEHGPCPAQAAADLGNATALSKHPAAAGIIAGDDAGNDAHGAAADLRATNNLTDAAMADPADDAAAHASRAASAVDRGADATRFHPADDIEKGLPALSTAHDAVFSRGQAAGERVDA